MSRFFVVFAWLLVLLSCTSQKTYSAGLPRPPCESDANLSLRRTTTEPPPCGGRAAPAAVLPVRLPPSATVAGYDTGAANPQDGNGPASVRPVQPSGPPHLVELSSSNWRPLKPKEKFALFYTDLYSWGTHLSLAIDAGLSFATNDRSYLGPGAAGYFSRYGLNLADEANFTFFNAFFFPTIFHEDPRYIPLDHGSTGVRLTYALTRVIITRNDSGKSELNKSKLLGTAIATSISSVYYSEYGGATGVGANFASIGVNLASEAAFDVFKEFWPDVARKLKINIWVRNLVRSSIRDAIHVR